MISSLLLAPAFTLLLYLSWRLLKQMKEFASPRPAGEQVTDEEIRNQLAKGRAANRTQLVWAATQFVTALTSLSLFANTGIWWPFLVALLTPLLMIVLLKLYCRR